MDVAFAFHLRKTLKLLAFFLRPSADAFDFITAAFRVLSFVSEPEK